MNRILFCEHLDSLLVFASKRIFFGFICSCNIKMLFSSFLFTCGILTLIFCFYLIFFWKWFSQFTHCPFCFLNQFTEWHKRDSEYSQCQNSEIKETGWTDKARSLSHWEVGYQSSLVFASWQFLDRFLSLLRLAYCFASIWIPYWLLRAKGIFLWIYMLL